MKKAAIAAAILLIMGACSFFPASVSNTPTLDATLTPEASPTSISRLLTYDLFCATSNEEARQAYNAAIEFEEQGLVEQAQESYLRAIELDPGFCDAMDNLGLLLRHQGNVEGAIYWYQRSVEVAPKNPVAHQNLGFAYRFKGQYEEALAEYQILMDIDPENPEGYFGAGQVYLYLDRPADAIPMLENAEQIYASSDYPLEYLWDAQYLLGVAHYFTGEYELCRDYLEPLYSLFETDAWVNYMLGMSYLEEPIRDLEKARFYLLRAQNLGMELPPEAQAAIEE